MIDSRPTATTPSLSGLALGVLLVAALVGELAPFVPLRNLPEAIQFLRAGLSLSATSALAAGIFERGILFAPLSWLLCWRWTLRARPRPVIAATLFAAALVVALETAQAWMPLRHPRFSDALIGSAAGVAGAVAGRLTFARYARWRVSQDVRCRFVKVGLIGWELALVAVVAAGHRGVALADWNETYPLLLANEATGDRPWYGELRGLAIYDRALDPAEVARAAAFPMSRDGASLRERWGAICNYSFDSPQRAVTALHVDPGVCPELSIPPPDTADSQLGDPGLRVRAPRTIRSVTSAGALTRTLQRAGTFTIEVSLVAPSAPQSGPARIVSISGNPDARNLTLGQAGHDLDLRVRTPRTGANGAWAICRTHGGALSPGDHHVAATFQHGALAIYVDGMPARPPLHLHRPTVLLFRGEFALASALAALLLVGPAGWLAGTSTNQKQRRRSPTRNVLQPIAAGLLASVPPIALSIGMAALFDRPQDMLLVTMSPVAGVIGAAIAACGVPGPALPRAGRPETHPSRLRQH